MWVDIVIASGIAFTQLALAWYGVHVSVMEHRIRNAEIIGLVGALGVGLTIWGAIRTGLTQQNLETTLARIQRNTEAPPKVEVNIPPSIPPQIIVAPPAPSSGPRVSGGFVQFLRTPEFLHGGQLAPKVRVDVNLYLVNKGTEPIYGVHRNFALAVAPIGNDPDKVDRDIHSKFREDSLRRFQLEIKANNRGFSVNTNEAVWNTLSFIPDNQEVVDALTDGTLRFYVYGWARWQEGKHDFDECLWLQRPLKPEITDSAIWHRCVD